MPDAFGTISNIGTLFIDEIYYTYDEPQLFTCVNRASQRYLTLLTDMEEPNKKWLLVSVSQARINQLKNNLLPLRNAFTCPEDIVWELKEELSGFKALPIDPKKISDEDLPEENTFLDLSISKESQERQYEIANDAINEHRDILDVSLEINESHQIKELSCGILSDVLSNIQNLVYSLACKAKTLRSKIPYDIKENCKLQVACTFEGSFGIRLKSNELCDLEWRTPLSDTLKEFSTLLTATKNIEQLSPYLLSQSPKTALIFRNLLNLLVESDVSICFCGASPNKYAFNSYFSYSELRDGLKIIDSEISNRTNQSTLRGTLVGANVKNMTFEFVDQDDKVIKGSISREVSIIFEIPRKVQILVEETIGKNTFTGEEKFNYKLIECTIIDEK